MASEAAAAPKRLEVAYALCVLLVVLDLFRLPGLVRRVNGDL